jgi:spore germination protein GerM
MSTRILIILAVSFSLISAIGVISSWFVIVKLNDERKEITENLAKNIADRLEQVEVKIYLSRETEDLVPVSRKITGRNDIERKTLEELLVGPTQAERRLFATFINKGVVIQDFQIKNGVATVDFNQRLEEGVAGSAWVLAIRSQIEKTLLQFDTINKVIISIDGRVDDILQP